MRTSSDPLREAAYAHLLGLSLPRQYTVQGPDDLVEVVQELLGIACRGRAVRVTLEVLV